MHDHDIASLISAWYCFAIRLKMEKSYIKNGYRAKGHGYSGLLADSKELISVFLPRYRDQHKNVRNLTQMDKG